MGTVNDSELCLVALSGGLRRIRILQTEQGKFRVKVILNNEEDERDLVTYRKHPREWASLDRLAKHIQHLGPPPVTLIFSSTGENQP